MPGTMQSDSARSEKSSLKVYQHIQNVKLWSQSNLKDIFCPGKAAQARIFADDNLILSSMPFKGNIF
jgi:hypothetical protein